MRIRIFWAAIFLLATFAVASDSSAQGLISVDTDDGLHARIRSANGSVLALFSWQNSVELHAIEQDYEAFSLTEIGNEERSGQFRFKGTGAEDGSCVFRSLPNEDLAAQLTVKITPEYGALRYDLDFEDLTGEDRALILRCQLPVAAEGWTWWDDIATGRVIEPEKRYVHHDREAAGKYPLGWYPLGTISDGHLRALTLAIPLNPPRIGRVGYDGDFFVEFDFGVSPDTKKFPSRATFSFRLYHSDPEWGMRGALKRYYDLHPTLFTKRANREGTWLPRTPTVTIERPADFWMTYHEHSSVKVNCLPYDNVTGIYAFLYVDPSKCGLSFSPPGRPSREAALELLESAKNDPSHPQHAGAVAIDRMAARRIDGGYYLQTQGGGWRGGSANFKINLDPDIVCIPKTGDSRFSHWWAEAEKYVMGVREGRHDGIYIDESEFHSYPIDFDREHFQYADHPLTWDPAEGRLGTLLGIAAYEHYKAIGDELHANGKLYMANGLPFFYGIFMPLFDVPGSEVWFQPKDWDLLFAKWLTAPGGRQRLIEMGMSEESIVELEKIGPVATIADSELNPRAWLRSDMMYYRRTLCYQKSYNMLFRLMGDKYKKAYSPDVFEEFVEWGMFFGLYPAVSGEVANNQEQYIDIFRKYVPVIHALNSAGWEPVTHARSSDPDIRVERFGYASQNSLQFTLRNFAPERREMTLSIDAEALKIREDAEFRDALADVALVAREVGGGVRTLRMDLGAGETRVVEVGRSAKP